MPDLLFEDVRESRIEDIRPYLDQPEAAGEGLFFHRLTVFLTYHCNLACPYCKTIARTKDELRARPEKKKTFTYGQFRALLDSFEGTPIRHVHFTGGEAALVRSLPEMVRLARVRGVGRISLTSNGTLPVQTYLGLVANGMDEIRISLDAADPTMGEQLTRKLGAWHAAVWTVRFLAAARTKDAPFFLILNAVVGDRNRRDLPRIVRFLLSLNPDDIKLITNVDERGRLAESSEGDTIKREIKQLLTSYPVQAFPLLRRKLTTIFAPDAIGLNDIQAPPGREWRCYIPLTERTDDGVYYYPCSVYNREGGSPLGRIDEPPGLQRAKTAAFVRQGGCLRDPICRRYCLHCTKNFNQRANEERA